MAHDNLKQEAKTFANKVGMNYLLQSATNIEKERFRGILYDRNGLPNLTVMLRFTSNSFSV